MRAGVGLFLFLAQFAFAAPPGAEKSWGNLSQLRPKEKIQVFDTKLRSYKGRFLSFTNEELTWEADGKARVLKREDVLQVKSRARSKRLRNIVIGAVVGAVAGAGLIVVMHGERSEDPVAPVGFILGMPIGAAIGAVPDSYEVIYQNQ